MSNVCTCDNIKQVFLLIEMQLHVEKFENLMTYIVVKVISFIVLNWELHVIHSL